MSEEFTCPGCGTPVKVVGRTTQHYEPLYPAEIKALSEKLAEEREAFSEIISKEKEDQLILTEHWAKLLAEKDARIKEWEIFAYDLFRSKQITRAQLDPFAKVPDEETMRNRFEVYMPKALGESQREGEE